MHLNHLLFNLIGLNEIDASSLVDSSFPEAIPQVTSRLADDQQYAISYCYCCVGIEFGTWYDLGVDIVYLYGKHDGEYQAFPGELPFGLSWEMSSADCRELLGKPCAVFRPGKKKLPHEQDDDGPTDNFDVGEYRLSLIFNNNLSEIVKVCSRGIDRYPPQGLVHRMKRSLSNLFN